MNFYILRQDEDSQHEVYVNREDFDNAVAEAVDKARHGAADDEADGRVRERTSTCASLAEVDRLLGRDDTGGPSWHEAGRPHDGKLACWKDADYRGGNAHLYRLTAESLHTAADTTMGYDQKRFHDLGLAEALSVDGIDPELRRVTDAMANGIAPCETAACVAGHAYVCAFGWRDYLQTAVRANGGVPTPKIGDRAAAELGMSAAQQAALFPAQPELDEITDAFNLEPQDWACPTARRNEIEERWEGSGECRADDMVVVLETLARRCDRVNAFIAAIDN